MKVPYLMLIILLATAIIGVLVDWLLKRMLPESKEIKGKHILLGIFAILVLAIVVVLFQSQENLVNYSVKTDVTNSTKRTKNISATPTIDAYDVSPDDLLEKGKKVFSTQITNLDGSGPDEIIVQWTTLETAYYPMGLDVFAWLSPGKWKRILHLEKPLEMCSPYGSDFATVDLLKDGTKQLITWIQCGSGAYLSMDFYKFAGLPFMERLPIKPKYPGQDYEPDWIESTPLIENGELYIVHLLDLYHYKLTPDGLIGEKKYIDFGPNGVVVDLQRNENDLLIFKPDHVSIKVGQYLYLRNPVEGKAPDTRILYSNDHILKIENSILFYGNIPGTTQIVTWGDPGGLLQVTVIK